MTKLAPPGTPATAPPGREADAGTGAPCTLVEVFATSLAARADAVALIADGQSYSYRQLDAWSSALSRLLQTHGVRRGDRIALRMAPGAEAIVTMLAILRTGAAYVPLDIRNPPSRNAFVLSDSGVVAFIGSPDGARISAGVPVIGEAQVTALRDAPPATVEAQSGAREEYFPAPEETAYVIYTSGTTGKPKGVPVHHGAVMALLSGAAQRFTFSPEDRWLLFHSLAFDVSVWEIWGAFSTGGRLVVLPHWTARSPEACLQVVREQGITVLSQTPTAFGTLSAAALHENADLPALRYVVFAGEKLIPGTLRGWARRFGLTHTVLVNMYGITETTVHSTFHEVAHEDIDGSDSVIGRPLPGFDHRVITPDGHDAEPGEQGVLWLAGPQVSKGYLNRPELTAERFRILRSADGSTRLFYRSGDLVQTRADGILVYRGREDSQVKLRGHRIELSDIEAAVRTHDRVMDAVVWIRTYGPGDERLVCAYTTEPPGDAIPARALREHAKNLLPAYMRPAVCRHVPQLPRTVNGKLDRDATARIWEEGKGHTK
ncbi:amino acid adenylation domain-containing protein [Streptomyces sp. NPDC059278]|uniref:amino acid adenylation domain-containing protein n=1 Tax=Streptomyces sp. NPDC059278 TaxID=3346801 RepID=UPI0036B695CB